MASMNLSQTEIDELNRLRRENDQLKQDLRMNTKGVQGPTVTGGQQQQQQQQLQRQQQQQPMTSWQRPQQPLTRWSPRQDPLARWQDPMWPSLRDRRPLLASRDFFGLPMAMSAFDEAFDGLGFLQGNFSMGGGPLLADSAKHIDLVQRRVEVLLENEMGKNCRCSEPTQQTYTASCIDGNMKRNVGLCCPVQCPATGNTGEVQVRATIDDNDCVCIDELNLSKSIPSTTVV